MTKSLSSLLFIFLCFAPSQIQTLELSVADVINAYLLGEEAAVGAQKMKVIYSFAEDKEYEKGPTQSYCMEKLCDDCYPLTSSNTNEMELMGWTWTLEECQTLCMDITSCKAIFFGNSGDEKDQCQLIYEQQWQSSRKKFNVHKPGMKENIAVWQGWTKKTGDCASGDLTRNYCMVKQCEDCQQSGGPGSMLVSDDMSYDDCLQSCMDDTDCLAAEMGEAGSKFENKCWYTTRGFRWTYNPNNNDRRLNGRHVWDKGSEIQCGGTAGTVPENVGNKFCMFHICDDCRWAGQSIDKRGSLSLDECLDACLQKPYCNAIMHNESEQNCELIGRRNWQEDAWDNERLGWNTYIRTNEQQCAIAGVESPSQMYCMEELCQDCYVERGTSNPPPPVALNMHGLLTLGQCKNACLIDDYCQAIEYGMNLNTEHGDLGENKDLCTIIQYRRKGESMKFKDNFKPYIGNFAYQKMPDHDGKCVGKSSATPSPEPEPETQPEPEEEQEPQCQHPDLTCETIIMQGLDASHCDCEDVCIQECQTYLNQGYTCQECELAGLKCSPCDECGHCDCQKYIDQGYSCEAIEAAGLDCSGCGNLCDIPGCTDELAQNYNPTATSDDGTCDYCVARTYFDYGYDCISLKKANMDVTGCGCEGVCACGDELSQGFTCGQLEGYGMNCEGCDCSPTCSETCQYYRKYYTCDQLAGFGLDCSGCDCDGSCSQSCADMLEQVTCETMSAQGLDCSGCDCSPKCVSFCQTYLNAGHTKETLVSAGYNCGGC